MFAIRVKNLISEMLVLQKRECLKQLILLLITYAKDDASVEAKLVKTEDLC